MGAHVGVLDDKDPTGAERLKSWADGLRQLAPGMPVRCEYQRMIHPGLVPAEGNGLLRAEGQYLLQVPGEYIQSITVLHYILAGSAQDQFDAIGRDAMYGALLTLVTDRRCQVCFRSSWHESKVTSTPSRSRWRARWTPRSVRPCPIGRRSTRRFVTRPPDSRASVTTIWVPSAPQSICTTARRC
jgi:hypothetical protein